MIRQAVQIQSDVLKGASLRNGEVVARSLTESAYWTCCSYLNNLNRFNSLLTEYVEAKVACYHAKAGRGARGHWGSFALMAADVALYNRATKLRAQLAAIWPCGRCKTLYNPTRRTNV